MVDLTIKERIQFALKHKNITISEISDGTDNDRVRLGRQINGKSELLIDTIDRIAKMLPDVSAEWLIRGEGTMDKAGHMAPQLIATQGSTINTGNATHGTISIGNSHPSYSPGGAKDPSPSAYALGIDTRDDASMRRLQSVLEAYEAHISALRMQLDESKAREQFLQKTIEQLTNKT